MRKLLTHTVSFDYKYSIYIIHISLHSIIYHLITINEIIPFIVRIQGRLFNHFFSEAKKTALRECCLLHHFLLGENLLKNFSLFFSIFSLTVQSFKRIPLPPPLTLKLLVFIYL